MNAPKLDAAERALYHQVHPLKLAVDVSTAILGVALLTEHRLSVALAVIWGPPILTSALLVRFGDFSRTKASCTGAYLRRYMTLTMQSVRFLGMGVAATGAWLHAWWMVPVGVVIVGWGWTGSWVVDRRRA